MLFVTHHKCASTVSARYIQKLCADNGLSFFPSARGNVRPSPRHQVSFLSNASYPFLDKFICWRVVHIIRNPLNVLQSAYYSHLRSHTVEGLPILAAQRRVLERCSADEGKALTLAFCERNDFFPRTPGPLCGLRQWNYDDERCVTVRMKDFGERIDQALSRAVGEEGAALAWPDPAPFTFHAMSGGREPGQVDETSAYRSGHPEAWRSELPRGLIDYVRAHFRPMLERFYPETLAD